MIPADKKWVKDVSKMMQNDLLNPDPRFPAAMISRFRDHAKEENILKEFENPDLISFFAIKNDALIGFIVGYKEDAQKAMIHYVSGDSFETKKKLLQKFIYECKNMKIDSIITDSFEFMENNTLFMKNGFMVVKKENITKNLEMLWYELKP